MVSEAEWEQIALDHPEHRGWELLNGTQIAPGRGSAGGTS